MSSSVLLRIAKILGFLLGALCAAFAASALFLLITWDGVQLQVQLAREFRDRLMRPLAMEHAPRLRFQPGPTVVIDGLALGNALGAGIPIKASRVEASLALFPLLRGKFEVERLRVLDPEVKLTREADGELDLADLAKLFDETPRPWPILWQLEGISIERGRLEYLEGRKTSALRFERISLTTGPLGQGARGRITGSASLTHGPGDASGGAELDLAYRFGDKHYELDYASLRFRGEALGATGLDATLNVRDGSGEPGRAPTLKGLSLRGHGRFGTNEMEVKANAKELANLNSALALQGLEAKLKLDDGKQRGEIELELPALAPRETGQPGDAFKLGIKTRGEDSHGEASLAGRAAFRSASGFIDLSALDLHWKNVGHGPAQWSARMGGRIAFAPLFQRGEAQLEASLDASRLKLNTSYAANRTPPWQYEASAEHIDLNRLASRLGLSGPSALLSALAAQPAHGQLRSNGVAVAGLHAGELSAMLTTGNGELLAESLKAQMYGGTLSGSLRYQSAGSLLTLDQKFDSINLAALSADLHRPLPVHGELSGHWLLHSPLGPSGKAFNALSGKTSFVLHKSAWQGMDVANLLRAVRPALKGRGQGERASQPREHEDFDALAMDCSLNAGLASCASFSGANSWLRLGGGGKLSLPEGRLDWLVRLAIQSHGKIERDLAGLRGLTIPMRLSGPLNRPQWRLDWNSPTPAPAKPAPSRPAHPLASASAAG
ncbi:AsmA family protein [Niveibacterium terrae]|uniref:AsmA family protein n=1 Tax=Niveibacterium terrae TaxID=3373598 RepID=UPI003A919E94